jgi:hypothetical protein
LEIRDKKGVDNYVADHLSRMQVKGSDLPIDDYLRDDTLLRVTTTSTWYANLVNFMVIGYIPPGEDRKKLIHHSRYHLWDDPIYSKSLLMVYSATASRNVRPTRFLSVVTPHHMEGIMEHSGPMLRFGRVDSSGQTWMVMLKSLCSDAQDVRNMGISIPETLCH